MLEVLQGVVEVLVKYAPLLTEGLKNTLLVTATSFAIGFALGLPLSIARMYGSPPLKLLVAVYVELIRGTPLMLQLFLAYYALPALGIALSPLQAAILALGLNSAAYQAEYFRTAMGSIPRGQWEAALGIGLSVSAAVRHVVVPQALRVAVPVLTNEAIYLLKYSSIASLITVPELLYVSRIITSRTFMYVQVYAFLGLTYVVLGSAIAKLMRRVEAAVAVPGLTVSHARSLTWA